MKHNIQITYFKPDRQGVYSIDGGFLFATEIEFSEECGLILYEQDNRETRIPFSKEGKRGTLYGIKVEGKDLPFVSYNYYDGDRIFTDPYAKVITGLETFGEYGNGQRETRGILHLEPFDWEGDGPLLTPYEDTIIYGLNVRGFTMHQSSGIRHKGTFEGITEKINYLKKLGITAIELMPAYEYDECMYLTDLSVQTMENALTNGVAEKKVSCRLNCWGYQRGFYFAPKSAYGTDKPDISFKKMVKLLHKNGIEVMMQFYFPSGLKQTYILEVLRYWVTEYHIDGMRLCGFQVPLTMIAQDPLLKETKIRSAYFPMDEIYGQEIPVYKNLAADNGNFRNDMRRYLKGDENLINQVLAYQKSNPDNHAVINYLADYDGFSLFDSVSYERKHNEANGEDNRDGTDSNFSWNCGIEGESRKKAICQLRMKQIKNGLSFLFLSQGVPYLFSGDEMANTRFGNNNAYCQDNETGWIKWKNSKFSNEIINFTAALIALRKKHPILHMKKELKIMDTLGNGYPDISYHGSEAWRPDTGYTSRMTGIMLCGDYVKDKADDFLYIAYNMHWEKHELALPKLPKGMKWEKVFATAKEEQKDMVSDENKILISERSILLYRSETDKAYEEKPRRRFKRKTAGKNESVATF